MSEHVLGVTSLALGFIGGLWAWRKIRGESGKPTVVGPVFLVSMALVVYGWIVVLPWSIGE